MKYLDLAGLSYVIDTINSKIKSTDSDLATKITNLNNALSTETSNRTSADNSLSGRITTIESWKTALTNTDTDNVINSYQEIVNFLQGIKNNTNGQQTLQQIIDGINSNISTAIGKLDVAAVGAGNNTTVITKVSQTDGKIVATSTPFSSFIGTTETTAYKGSDGLNNANNINAIVANLGKQNIVVTESDFTHPKSGQQTSQFAQTSYGSVMFTYDNGKSTTNSVTISSITRQEIDEMFQDATNPGLTQ